MANYTPILNLYKPSRLDYDVDLDQGLSQNFQNIDEELGPLADTTGEFTFAYDAEGRAQTISTPSKTYTFIYTGDDVDYIDESDATGTIRTTFSRDTEGKITNITRAVV